jgi:hypothetical protein
MLYQYKPHLNDPQAAVLPYGLRLKVIPGTREGLGEIVFAETRRPEDARLIAAAPELLAALKDCRAWIAQYHQLKGHEAASLSMTDYLDRVISNAEEVNQ